MTQKAIDKLPWKANRFEFVLDYAGVMVGCDMEMMDVDG